MIGNSADYRKLRFQIAVADRANSMGLLKSDIVTFLIDLDVVDMYFDVRYQDWLDGPAFDFAHDVVGIQTHVDREYHTMDGRFMPRYARERATV